MLEPEEDKKLSADGVPFPAVVGQSRLKQSLVVAASNSAVDGVLVRGEKGTAKSTTARGLAAALPPQQAVADCPYGCPPDGPGQCVSCREQSSLSVEERSVPFVTLPLGASRDRVVGSLSVTDALDGEPSFEPGLLAQAHRGFLYVDEVNLLDDHLVDVLLDAAASGVNRVERGGVSRQHPSEFTLIGTMNPEEGTLRPQFRDRFTMQVTVEGAEALDDRATVVRRALDGFDGEYTAETTRLRDRIETARSVDVTLPADLLREVVELCRDAGVDGHRADIATARVARTLAALDERPRVIESDVRRAAEYTLPHRLETTPFDDASDASDVIDDQFGEPDDDGETDADGESDASNETDADDRADGESDASNETDADDRADGESGADSEPETGAESDGGSDRPDATEDRSEAADDGENGRTAGPGGRGGTDERDFDPHGETPDGSTADGDTQNGDADPDGTAGNDGAADDGEETAPARPLGAEREATPTDTRAPTVDAPTPERAGDGEHTAGRPDPGGRGARVRTERAEPTDEVDAAASVRAAVSRGGDGVTATDLRRSVRTGGESALVVFLLDASASMRRPMEAAKSVALDLLQDAYERRDEVAVVTFAGERADVALPPTDSVDLAARHLKSLPTGDRTPLAAGITTGTDVIERASPETAVVVLVTDGRATAGEEPIADTRTAARRLGETDTGVLVVDAGTDDRSLVSDVVTATDGRRVSLAELTPDRVAGAVRRAEADR